MVNGRHGPREKLLLRGEQTCSDAELLSLLLGAGVAGRSVDEVAAGLLQKVGGLEALATSTAQDLARFRGIGVARATRVAAAFELARRTSSSKPAERKAIRSGAQVDSLYRSLLATKEKECFLVLLLDARNRIFREEIIVEGTLVSAPVDPREVFSPAIRHRAAAILVAHNHPSGDPSPSSEDHEVTRRLQMAGEVLGIPLLDHVVIAREGYVSFLENGWM